MWIKIFNGSILVFQCRQVENSVFGLIIIGDKSQFQLTEHLPLRSLRVAIKIITFLAKMLWENARVISS